MIRHTLSRAARCAAVLLMLAGSVAMAAPSPSAAAPQRLADALAPAMSTPSLCKPATSDAIGANARPAKDGNGAQQVALGTTHCWWACYPGSGCEYVCRFFPQ